MFYNNGAPNNYYSYGVARPQARNTQPLTQEQINKLSQDSSAFDMKVEQEDLWRAACTHKQKNGQSSLIQNADGSVTCTICHETFQMRDVSKEEVTAAVNTLIDLLQTTKTVYLDAPEALISQYFQLLALLKKFPELWDRAIKNFSMYENFSTNVVHSMAPGYSGFDALNVMMNNPYGGFYGQQPVYPTPAPQQPVAPQPMPMYPNQQPMMNGYPTMGYQQPPMPMYQPGMVNDPNPMAYCAPTAPAPGVMPTAPAPAAAPAPQQTEVQQQQTFNV